MPELATSPRLPSASADAPPLSTQCHAGPADPMSVASAALPGDAWLHRMWQFTWQELPAKAAALGAFLVERAKAVVLHEAVEYCARLTDWTLQAISYRTETAHDPTIPLGQSLLLAAASALPSSHEVCEGALTQLQVQAKTLLDNLHPASPGDAGAEPLRIASASQPAPPLTADFSDICSDLPGEESGQRPDPAPAIAPGECKGTDTADCVCLIGGADPSSFASLL